MKSIKIISIIGAILLLFVNVSRFVSGDEKWWEFIIFLYPPIMMIILAYNTKSDIKKK